MKLKITIIAGDFEEWPSKSQLSRGFWADGPKPPEFSTPPRRGRGGGRREGKIQRKNRVPRYLEPKWRQAMVVQGGRYMGACVRRIPAQESVGQDRYQAQVQVPSLPTYLPSLGPLGAENLEIGISESISVCF